MNNVDQREFKRSGGGALLPWFWIGTGVGILLSTAAVVVATELTRRRYRPLTKTEQIAEDMLLVEDLTFALKESLAVLAEAADQIGYADYSAANQERIRFGLDPGQTGAGSSGWYTGDDDTDLQ